MRSWRNSQLRLYDECGWAYASAYVWMTEPMPSPTLHGGQNVHNAVRAMVHEIVNGAETLDVHNIAYRVVRGSPTEYFDALRVLTLLQEQLIEDFKIDSKGAFLVEERLTKVVTVRGELHEYWGTPDLGERVTKRRVRITDWKTDWAPWPFEVFLAHKQLPRYALLINDKFPAFTEFELVMRFVRHRNNFHTRVITVDELPQIERDLVQQIAAAADREDRQDFKPTPGNWCSICTHHHTCPVIKALRAGAIDDLSIPNDTRAEELAGQVVAAQAFAAAAGDRLKRYLSEHQTGFVQLSGGSYGYGPVEEREVYWPQLRSALVDAGVQPPDRLAKTDLKELDRYRNKLPENLVAVIEENTVRRTSAECKYRRVPDPRVPKKKRREAAVVTGNLFE